jgi:FkbM family methyltransferase
VKQESSLPLAISPELRESRRARVLSNPILREVARAIVHRRRSLMGLVAGAHAGAVTIQMCGESLRYALGPRDMIGDLLYWAGESSWEVEVVPVFAQEARKAEGLVLDIGANCGIYSLLTAALNPLSQVIAWEPTFLADRIAHSAKLNDFSGRIEVRQCAAGAAPGETMFYEHRDLTMGSLIEREGSVAGVPVRVERVDDVVGDRPVGFVKIDVEGSEPEVFSGMARTIERWRPTIIFECLKQKSWEPCISLLDGYRFEGLTPSGRIPATGHTEGVTNYLAQWENL